MKILLAVDGSQASLAAVRHALRLVDDGLRAEFVLANVQPPATFYEMLRAPDAQTLLQIQAGAGEDSLEVAAAMLAQAEVSFEQEVASGEAAPVLAEMVECHGVDAVMVGARRSSAARWALGGSVSHWLLSHSPVPVTVVHLEEDGEGEGHEA